MKRLLFGALACLLALTACGQGDLEDYTLRMQAYDGALKPFMTLPEGISAQEREALQFLYAYMPLADVTDYPAEFYLANVRKSFQAREELPWKVPEREFRHFVLPLRTNNEDLDSARLVFYDELKPRVEKLSMKDAILEVNHWCHEKMTYQPSDGRTHAP
ncbi:MAG: transglutaminase domain-containing protein, partial [Bacteroidales bacterium]|nr:transglutaminase domain-containing protein [Bacteroidales bacterium]